MSVAEEIVFVSVIGGAIFFGFGILGMIAEAVFHHCKWLSDWIDTLPMTQEK